MAGGSISIGAVKVSESLRDFNSNEYSAKVEICQAVYLLIISSQMA